MLKHMLKLKVQLLVYSFIFHNLKITDITGASLCKKEPTDELKYFI
jgi:hypothetical protein